MNSEIGSRMSSFSASSVVSAGAGLRESREVRRRLEVRDERAPDSLHVQDAARPRGDDANALFPDGERGVAGGDLEPAEAQPERRRETRRVERHAERPVLALRAGERAQAPRREGRLRRRRTGRDAGRRAAARPALRPPRPPPWRRPVAPGRSGARPSKGARGARGAAHRGRRRSRIAPRRPGRRRRRPRPGRPATARRTSGRGGSPTVRRAPARDGRRGPRPARPEARARARTRPTVPSSSTASIASSTSGTGTKLVAARRRQAPVRPDEADGARDPRLRGPLHGGTSLRLAHPSDVDAADRRAARQHVALEERDDPEQRPRARRRSRGRTRRARAPFERGGEVGSRSRGTGRTRTDDGSECPRGLRRGA